MFTHVFWYMRMDRIDKLGSTLGRVDWVLLQINHSMQKIH